jgi:hypothetical protein
MQKKLLQTLNLLGNQKAKKTTNKKDQRALMTISDKASIVTRGIMGRTVEDPTMFTKRM